MINLRILAPSQIKYFGDLYPFRRWNEQLQEAGINVEIFFDHKNKKLFNSDRVLLHHRYFDSGWVNALKTATDVNGDFINYLSNLRANVGKLIWFDADDSSGTTQFPVIPFVDTFVKKQVLKDKSYYVGNPNESKNLMVWCDQNAEQKQFSPCSEDQIQKIKVGWNIALYDYRNFFIHYNIRKYLSHYVNHNTFPLKYTGVNNNRPFDVSFRGTTNYSTKYSIVAFQRNRVLEVFKTLPYKLAAGGNVHRYKYLDELNHSKISISPFGFGEICFRDFESFISGALLVKPSMEHLETFPDIFKPGETYVPVSWDLSDLNETLDKIINNYQFYQQIAINGQAMYKKIINDPVIFVEAVKRVIS